MFVCVWESENSDPFWWLIYGHPLSLYTHRIYVCMNKILELIIRSYFFKRFEIKKKILNRDSLFFWIMLSSTPVFFLSGSVFSLYSEVATFSLIFWHQRLLKEKFNNNGRQTHTHTIRMMSVPAQRSPLILMCVCVLLLLGPLNSHLTHIFLALV